MARDALAERYAWLASDNLGGAVIALIWMAAVIFLLAAASAIASGALRAARRPRRRPPGSPAG